MMGKEGGGGFGERKKEGDSESGVTEISGGVGVTQQG